MSLLAFMDEIEAYLMEEGAIHKFEPVDHRRNFLLDDGRIYIELTTYGTTREVRARVGEDFHKGYGARRIVKSLKGFKTRIANRRKANLKRDKEKEQYRLYQLEEQAKYEAAVDASLKGLNTPINVEDLKRSHRLKIGSHDFNVYQSWKTDDLMIGLALNLITYPMTLRDFLTDDVIRTLFFDDHFGKLLNDTVV